MDGEPFGVRFETEHSPPPGRAVVISEGRATPVQLAAPCSPVQRGPAAQPAPVRPAGGQVRISPGQHAARDGPLQGGRGSGCP
jgi:S-DNA-T family DNA segregation ATPase FtsK/SpoIIIE